MKQIKTIVVSSGNMDDFVFKFDKQVNAALNEGFIMTKRQYYNAQPAGNSGDVIWSKLYAELEREI